MWDGARRRRHPHSHQLVDVMTVVAHAKAGRKALPRRSRFVFFETGVVVFFRGISEEQIFSRCVLRFLRRVFHEVPFRRTLIIRPRNLRSPAVYRVVL